MNWAPDEITTGNVTGEAHLHRAFLLLAWVGLAIIVVSKLGLFFMSLPDYYVLLHRLCVGSTCTLSEALGPDDVRALHALGLSLDSYAWYFVVLQVIAKVMGIATGVFFFVFIAFRKPREHMALFIMLLVVLQSGNLGPMLALVQLHPFWRLPAFFLTSISALALPLFLFLFPDGGFVPRWTRWLVIVPVINGVLLGASGPSSTPFAQAAAFAWVGVIGLGLFAQIYRYVRVSTLVQRQQTKWLVFGGAVTFLVGAIGSLPLPMSHSSLPGLLLAGAIALSFLMIPLSVGIAILRYRLWDIDIIIKRTLVYSILTTCVVGLYVLVVGYLGALFHTNGNLLISLIATGLVAILFQPLRDLLQRGINRLVYGLRDEPYVVLSRLGQRLKTTLDPDAVLSTIVATVREALRLSYAAIEVQEGSNFALAASSGTPPAKEALRLPLAYQNEPVGTLIIAPRGRDDTLTPADLRLLDDLTQQIANAVHTVRLTSELQVLTRDLQRSREQLVSAREEERRRLRRDLHDGLGPMLSAIMLKVGLVRTLYRRDLETTETLLKQLESEIETVIGDIRSVVYNLRPPALDELGLVGALREYVAGFGNDEGHHAVPKVSVEASASLPALPAAVEVAAYRIVQEAVTNVIRHAHAHSCCVRFQVKKTFEIEVSDDGTGIEEADRVGVGLTSMRERAEELGGTLSIRNIAPHGTHVTACLPLPDAAGVDARV